MRGETIALSHPGYALLIINYCGGGLASGIAITIGRGQVGVLF